jgi:hypothetical protein
MSDLTCQDLASRIVDLLSLLRLPVQPVTDLSETHAVDYVWGNSRGAAELYVHQHLSWALGRLGSLQSVGDPVQDARVALGGWGRLQQLQGALSDRHFRRHSPAAGRPHCRSR